jgi:acetoin utilization deacetylase AcuC-like enzyme
MKPTGIVRDQVYLRHDMGLYHPESPDRLQVIYDMLDEFESALNLIKISPRHASIQEITANHDHRYVQNIAATAGARNTYLDPDTSACEHSWDAASMAVGGLLNLLDAVAANTVRNGFALVRPPGHHAERKRAMGFCFFNNVAVAARYALERLGMERVAIVDWDLHHGNGTQNAFYESRQVLFISTHQYPHYPGSGAVREIGYGQGEGYTVNVPLAAGAGDTEYVTVFQSLVIPILESYRPDLILVSAGFDAHESDPLGGMNVTEGGYEQMIQILMSLAEDCCEGRLVLTLEGGYNLAALRNSVKRILLKLSYYDPTNDGLPSRLPWDSLHPGFRKRMTEIIALHAKYWPHLVLP